MPNFERMATLLPRPPQSGYYDPMALFAAYPHCGEKAVAMVAETVGDVGGFLHRRQSHPHRIGDSAGLHLQRS
jgi:hypothetical protein